MAAKPAGNSTFAGNTFAERKPLGAVEEAEAVAGYTPSVAGSRPSVVSRAAGSSRVLFGILEVRTSRQLAGTDKLAAETVGDGDCFFGGAWAWR